MYFKIALNGDQDTYPTIDSGISVGIPIMPASLLFIFANNDYPKSELEEKITAEPISLYVFSLT
ncbi:MAG: hypothetical protein AB1589_16950 [Cyanobacteriota bacterium]